MEDPAALGEGWEYGDAIGDEGSSDEETELLATVFDADDDSIDDETVQRAIEALLPFVSEPRFAAFERVASLRTSNLRVGFERPSNPNNVWACLRTIDAYGVQRVDVVPDDAETAAMRATARGVASDGPTDRQRARIGGMTAAMGAQKWLTLREHADAAALVARLKADGCIVCATDLDPGAVPVGAVDWASGKHALLFGNEEVGISSALRELADVRVHIPMRGLAESLNLSVSVGACLSHVDAVGGLPPNLSRSDKQRLLLRWSMLSVRGALPVLARAGVDLPPSWRRKHSTILGASTK